MEAAVSQRIAILRFIMIAGIVLVHTPMYVPIAETGSDWFSVTKAFFQQAVFRTTVPVLSFISGYLLFSSGAYRRPLALLKKKGKSILLPFLVFNLLLLAAAYLAQARLGVSLSYRLTPFDPAVWLDAAFGLTAPPINYPLNFLRDLLVLMVLAPGFGVLLHRAPWCGLAGVAAVFYLNLDGYLVLRGLMPIVFFAGGMAAVGKWNMTLLDRFALPLLAAFAALCTAIVYFRIANTTCLRLAAPILLWPAVSLLAGTAVGDWAARMSKYSFLIFLAHAPVLLATWMVYRRLEALIPYPLYWAAAPVFTIAALVGLYEAAMRLCPRLLNAALGLRPAAKMPHATAPKEARLGAQ